MSENIDPSKRYISDPTWGTLSWSTLSRHIGRPGSNAFAWTSQYDAVTDVWTLTTPDGKAHRYSALNR